MTIKPHATPSAFDRAMKKAVKTAGGDPGELYRQALHDRFLCRVFFEGNEHFVLKGGSGMLARVPDARTTKDLDFATQKRADAQEALEEMKRIAAIDLGDWCEFRLTRSAESMDENGYSRLLRLRFATFIGREEKDPILIDLSLDCGTTLPPERITPANRIAIEGITCCDYLAYPLPDQPADKLCAIMELQPGGWPSSRMKDLVDVVVYATNESFDSSQLKHAIECECAKRQMEVPERFAAPTTWEKRYEPFARKNGSPEAFAPFECACALTSRFFDPVLSGTCDETAAWDCKGLQWS